MAFENRGGIPRVFRASIPTTGRPHDPKFTSKFLQISNEGANVLRVYFTKEDFDADANYIALAATIGFYEGPAEVQTVWFRAVAGATDVVAIFYQRRG